MDHLGPGFVFIVDPNSTYQPHTEPQFDLSTHAVSLWMNSTDEATEWDQDHHSMSSVVQYQKYWRQA